MTVHSGGREDHRHADFVFALRLICQNDVARTRAHSIFRLGANTCETVLKSICATLERAINRDKICVEITRQLIPLRVANKRTVEHENFGLRRAFVQNVLKITEARLQAHHTEFAQ